MDVRIVREGGEDFGRERERRERLVKLDGEDNEDV